MKNRISVSELAKRASLDDEDVKYIRATTKH